MNANTHLPGRRAGRHAARATAARSSTCCAAGVPAARHGLPNGCRFCRAGGLSRLLLITVHTSVHVSLGSTAALQCQAVALYCAARAPGARWPDQAARLSCACTPAGRRRVAAVATWRAAAWRDCADADAARATGVHPAGLHAGARRSLPDPAYRPAPCCAVLDYPGHFLHTINRNSSILTQ